MEKIIFLVFHILFIAPVFYVSFLFTEVLVLDPVRRILEEYKGLKMMDV